MMRHFRTAKGMIGLGLVLFALAVAILAPMLIPVEWSTRMNMMARLHPPSWQHPLGTDQLGRDLLFRVLLGARTSMEISVAAVMLSIVVGLPLGMISGYAGGWVDNVLMRIVDALLAFPALLLALAISAVLGPNLRNTMIAIGVAFTPFLARIIRGEALRVAQLPFIEAARASGTNHVNMLIRHILPNVMPATIVQGTISIAFAILAEAGLSFLGLGTQPPNASWGLMIQASRNYLDMAPWTALVPGAAVALAVLGFNMFGDVVRDILDPRSK